MRAVVIRNDVLVSLGGFGSAFDTAAGAALDAGLRWISAGAFIRHVPHLLPDSPIRLRDPNPSVADGLRIVRNQLGRTWAGWGLFRGLCKGDVRAWDLPKVFRVILGPTPTTVDACGLAVPGGVTSVGGARVTVLIPTVGRYPYLIPLLKQLGAQTRPPDEVVIIDQNPEGVRVDLHSISPHLPLRVLYLDPPGQCTARNLGLGAATGSHLLFLDDDDEVPCDLIEEHLRVLAPPAVSVSCGLVDDAESGPAPPGQRFRRAADTFPTNNLMLKRSVLDAVGLFDPTYDRGARADHDLGMRSYLAGHLHVYDPGPRVFHHHAPIGGLRTHGARIRTRGNSRSTVLQRHLRTATDIYLGLRYYSIEQVREDLLLSVFATLMGTGSRRKRALRWAVQVLLLPNTWMRSRAAWREGLRLFRERGEIPRLPKEPTRD